MCSKNFCVQAKGGHRPVPPPPKYATGYRGVTSDLAGNGDIRNFARSLQSVPRSTLVCCHQLRERSTSTVCAATCNSSDAPGRFASLSLCLYLCLFAIIKTRSSNFPELLMMMPVARSTASQVRQ